MGAPLELTAAASLVVVVEVVVVAVAVVVCVTCDTVVWVVCAGEEVWVWSGAGPETVAACCCVL